MFGFTTLTSECSGVLLDASLQGLVVRVDILDQYRVPFVLLLLLLRSARVVNVKFMERKAATKRIFFIVQ